jgi:hypothetical protein
MTCSSLMIEKLEMSAQNKPTPNIGSFLQIIV